MGNVSATPNGKIQHLGRATRRFTLSGTAFEGKQSNGEEGALWLDAKDGFIVDAIFPIPNHPGYTDFRLKLDRVSDGGLAEWNALLQAHFEGCDE